MNENKIREALAAINANPKDEKAAGLLRKELAGYCVIARQPNGPVDVNETMQNLAFALETGCNAMDGCLSIDELLVKEKPKIEADPVDGRPLRNGKTVTQPIVNWQPVSVERRRLVVLAKMRRELPHAVSSVPSEMIAYDLAQERLPAPWPRMELEMEKLHKAAKETTKEGRAARDMLEAVDEGLWFQRQRVSEQPPIGPRPYITTPQEILSDPQASPQASAVGQCEATAKTDLFIVAIDRDIRKADELFRHCRAIEKKQGSWLCPSGANREAWLRAEINKARVIVAAVSADLLYDDGMMNLLQSSYKGGKRVVPWVIRACDWKSTFFGNLRELPEEEHLATIDIKRILLTP